MQKDKPITLGLDIGGTKLKAIALAGDKEVLADTVVPSDASQGPDAVRRACHTVIKNFQEKKIPFEAVGVGCAGSVDSDHGIVRNSPNFANWHDVSIRKWIETDFKVPCAVENDANCAVVAEWKAGAAIGCKNVVLLTLGTGIGGGLILNNSLFRGATGTGGELGHLTIHADGVPCPCGNTGCFERYCSATAVKIKANGVSPKEVFAKAEENPTYRRIIDEFIHDFQIALVGIANVFDPDCILLGGAVTDGVSLYLQKIDQWVREHAFPAVAAHLKIQTTEYKNLSGSLGAAHLARELLATQHRLQNI